MKPKNIKILFIGMVAFSMLTSIFFVFKFILNSDAFQPIPEDFFVPQHIEEKRNHIIREGFYWILGIISLGSFFISLIHFSFLKFTKKEREKIEKR